MSEKCDIVKLGEVITLISGRDLLPEQYSDNNIGLPYITGASNIVNGQILINRWTDQPVSISKIGDVVLTCKGTVGLTAFNIIGDCHLARQLMALRPNNELIDTVYLKFAVDNGINQLVHLARSMIPGISRKDVLDTKIPLPPLAEQKHIASTLSAVDKAIEQAGIAIEESERIKRGLMQKLLNGSGSSTSLKDIFDFRNGKKYAGITGNVPIYGGNGILGYASESNCDNAIIIGRVGANCGSVHYENSKCWVSDNAIICKKKIECSAEYLYYALMALNLNTIHVGSGQPLMTKGILDKLSVYLPPFEKQEKIVQILLNADEEIKLKNHRKSLLETLKRGMMQQLLAGAK